MWVLTNALCKSSLGAPDHGTKILKAENGQKLTSNYIGNYRYISVITDVDEKSFVVCKHTINRLSFGYARLLQLENIIFLVLHFFLTFLLTPSAFKLLNALYSKFERLKIPGRTFVRMKSGVSGLGDLPQSGPPKF